MHNDLHRLLPPDVYHELDSSSGMEPEKRAKLQETCKNHNMVNLLDPTTSSTFGHQTALSLSDGAHFDPLKRGTGFAGAGLSVTADSGCSQLQVSSPKTPTSGRLGP
jgi:hypothetical protein